LPEGSVSLRCIGLLESVSLRAAIRLQAWDAHGFHRTGASGDEAGAAWLANEATALGAAVTSDAFSFERVDPQQTFLELHRAGAAGQARRSVISRPPA
jgi:hypothetical protein